MEAMKTTWRQFEHCYQLARQVASYKMSIGAYHPETIWAVFGFMPTLVVKTAILRQHSPIQQKIESRPTRYIEDDQIDAGSLVQGLVMI